MLNFKRIIGIIDIFLIVFGLVLSNDQGMVDHIFDNFIFYRV